jgi:hypothetical protein
MFPDTSEPRLAASKPVKLLDLREHDAGGYAYLGRDRILLITGVAASWDHTRFNVVLGFDDVIRKRFAALQGDAP